MFEISSIEIDWPEHLKWYLTQEGRDKAMADIDVMGDFLRQAGEIADRYGFVLSVEIEEKE